MKEAEQQAMGESKKGIAWGIREAVFGKPSPRQPDTATPMTNAGVREANEVQQENGKG